MERDFRKKWTEYFREVLGYFSKKEPINFTPLDSSPEALIRDVEYALKNASTWEYFFLNEKESIEGKKVLEIGPGINFGVMMILACRGAEVMVADRFLTPWDPEYHPRFYRLLKDKLISRWSSIDPSPLDAVISQKQYPPEVISLYSCSLEEISVVPDDSVDLVLSNAVFEHLYDPKAAFCHLFRITKPGGLGIHMVDFRDHRDFSQPLEFLLLSEKKFSRKFQEYRGECGNRYRPQEMQELLESAGFEVRNFFPDIFTDEAYLTEFLGRLRPARGSRYCDYPAENLRYLSGRFLVVKREE